MSAPNAFNIGLNYGTDHKEGVNRSMQIHRTVPSFRQIRLSAKMFVQIRNHNHIRKQRCKGSKLNWYM